MLDWNDYRRELKGRIGELGKLSPDTLKGYITLSGAGAQTNHLDGKTRELLHDAKVWLSLTRVDAAHWQLDNHAEGYQLDIASTAADEGTSP